LSEQTLTKQTIRPKNFEVKEHLWDSPFQNCEREIIARNLILISQWNNNEWLTFTWEEYQKRCKHNVGIGEKYILDEFVLRGLLTFHEGVYTIEDYFIWYLSKFISKKN
jgi:hypothetical protein